jgi:WD40 repeat protein
MAIGAPPRPEDPPWLVVRLGNPRFRQNEAVWGLSYSPDGRHIASSDSDSIHIWDAADGRRVRTITIPNQEFFALRHSPDGRTLLAASTDDRSTRLIRIDPSTGNVLSDTAVRAGKAEGLFSVDGAWLALRPTPFVTHVLPAPKPNSLVHVVNVLTGNDWTNKLDDEEIRSLTFSSDGTAVAVGTEQGTIRVFESKSGRGVRRHQVIGAVVAFSFSPEGKHLIAGIVNPPNNRIVMLDATSGKEIWRRSVYDALHVAFVNGGREAVYYGMDQESRHPRCWSWLDAASGKPTGTILEPGTEPLLQPHGGIPPTAIAWQSNGRILATGTRFGLITQWDLTTRKRLPASADPPSPVADLHMTTDGRRIQGWTSDGWYEWDIESGRQRRLTPAQFIAQSGPVSISRDQRWLARYAEGHSQSSDPVAIDVIEVSGKRKHSLTGLRTYSSPDFLPDGRLGIWNGDGLSVYDLETGKRTVRIEYGDNKGGPHLTPDSRLLAKVARLDAKVRITIWRLDSGKVVSDWSGEIRELGDWDREVGHKRELSPTGRLVALKSERLVAPNVTEPRTILLETATGRKLADWVGHHSDGIRFTPDGRSLLEYSLQPFSFFLREVSTGGYRAQYIYARRTVTNFTFSPDARKLIVSTRPYPVEIWDLVDKPGEWEARKPDALWEALAVAHNAEHAYGAIRHLRAHPAKAVPFLKDRMKVPQLPDAKWLKERLQGLDAPVFRDRERATADLAAAGEVVVAGLREARKTASAEAQARLKPLIEKAEAMTPEKLRAIRACEVLEGLGTPEALSLLESWARGAPETTLVREAKESVERIKARLK